MYDILQIGDKVDVRQADMDGRPLSTARTYVSKLLDFIDEETVSISMPLGSGHVIILGQGERYRLHFYTAKGVYQCDCIMLSTYRENSTIIAAVKLISDLEKVQRRQYYRLECIHEIEYRLVTQEELQLELRLRQDRFINQEEKTRVRRILSQMDQQWQKASITDLSGGGTKFISDMRHNIGDNVRIKLNFIAGGELKKFVLGAEIIAIDKLLNRSGKYEHRAEFTDIGKADRESLIKYVFEQERRRRKNEKA